MMRNDALLVLAPETSKRVRAVDGDSIAISAAPSRCDCCRKRPATFIDADRPALLCGRCSMRQCW